MSDIVDRLRQYAENDMRVEAVCLAAADEIERLREELSRAEIQADYETETAHVAIEEVKRLRAVLSRIASGRLDGSTLPSYPPRDPAMILALAALEGKND